MLQRRLLKLQSLTIHLQKHHNSTMALSRLLLLRQLHLVFPAEYVEAMLNTPVTEKPVVVEIKQVMASNLTANVKKTVVANMIKESELDSANINRCKDYWKNELGYGDPEWVDELFKNS